MSWLVLRLTGNGVDLGLMTACTFVPLLVFGPYSGTLVDRFDRRRLLIVTQTLLLLLAALAATLIATGLVRLWMLFVIAALTGCVSAPDGTARQVYVIDLVGHRAARERGQPVRGRAEHLARGRARGRRRAARHRRRRRLLRAQRRVLPAAAVRSAPASTAAMPPLGRPLRRTRTAPPGQLRAGLRYAWRNRPIRVCLFLAASSGLLFNLSVTAAAAGDPRVPPRRRRIRPDDGGVRHRRAAGRAARLGGPGPPDRPVRRRARPRDRGRRTRHGRRPGAVAGDGGDWRRPAASRSGSSPRRTRSSSWLRSVDARPGDGPVDHGAARHRARDQPVRRLHQPDVRRQRRLQPVRPGAAADRHDRLARPHGPPSASGRRAPPPPQPKRRCRPQRPQWRKRPR